jgi:transposase-like protein
MSIRASRFELTAHHNQLLWFCSNGQPLEMSHLAQAIRHFANPDTCIDFLANLRWPNGVTCPKCGSKEVSFISTRRIWKCKEKHDHRQFSAKVGTIMEDSPIPLDKWLTAMWLICNCRNGVSSYEIARDLGVTQKSAWFMAHRIRLAMQNGSFNKLGGPGGEVECDEAFIGGKAKNMHEKRRVALRQARQSSLHGDTRLIGKAAVMECWTEISAKYGQPWFRPSIVKPCKPQS